MPGPIAFAYFSNSMKMDTMKELLDKFAEIDANRDGLVDINEFAKYLSLPVTSHVKHLFTLYDRVSLQWTFKRWYDIRLLTRNGGCYFSCVRPQVRYACVYISVGNWVLVFFLRSVTCAYRGVYSRVGRRFCWCHFMRVRSVVHERDVEERVCIFSFALCWFLFKERKLVCFTRIWYHQRFLDLKTTQTLRLNICR